MSRARPVARLARAAVAGAMLLGAVGCASLPQGSQPVARDPFERVNRSVFVFNDTLDRAVTRPAARAYEAVVPEFVRGYVGNFFGNVGDVFTAVNQLLQGKPAQAVSDAGRVLVNTTFGLVGLIDIASELGMDKHREDFGQTLGRWGIASGPFLMLPVLGPSSVRDGVGLVADIATDPLRSIPLEDERTYLFMLRLIDTRQSLLGAERVVEGAALDRYSFLRDAYLQRRRNQVYDGDPPPQDDPQDEGDAPGGQADPEAGSAADAAGGVATPVPSPPSAGQPDKPPSR